MDSTRTSMRRRTTHTTADGGVSAIRCNVRPLPGTRGGRPQVQGAIRLRDITRVGHVLLGEPAASDAEGEAGRARRARRLRVHARGRRHSTSSTASGDASYGPGLTGLGRAHAGSRQDVHSWLRRGSRRTAILVPTEYGIRRRTPYLDALASGLDRRSTSSGRGRKSSQPGSPSPMPIGPRRSSGGRRSSGTTIPSTTSPGEI